MKNNSKDIIRTSGIAFGTSGARGLVTDFTPGVCAAFATNFLLVAATNFGFTHVAIGMDNRPGSYAMAQACAAAVMQQGCTPLFYGVVPTPALAYFAMSQQIPAIMVTGSHIPYDRNGLKFYRPDGEITKADEAAILTADAIIHADFELPHLVTRPDAKNHYIKRYLSFFPDNALNGIRIGVYEHSSAGRDIYTELFTALGAEVLGLGRSDDFVPIDTEAVSVDDKNRAVQWMKEYNLDAIFSTDGDGDRPLLSDENGEWLRGDILGLLCCRLLAIDAVAVPVSCNSAVIKSQAFKHVELTRIGSPYVIDAFSSLSQRYQKIAGFEANGGYLLGSDIIADGKFLKALPTRDAVLPALAVLVASQQCNISQQLLMLPRRYTASDRLQDFSSQRSQPLLTLLRQDPQAFFDKIGLKDALPVEMDLTDGVRITMKNKDIIHLRPSGNAPELRCYSESDSVSQAETLVCVCLEKIKTLF